MPPIFEAAVEVGLKQGAKDEAQNALQVIFASERYDGNDLHKSLPEPSEEWNSSTMFKSTDPSYHFRLSNLTYEMERDWMAMPADWDHVRLRGER